MALSDKKLDAAIDDLLPLAAVVEEVGCDRSHVTRLLQRKKLEGRKIGMQWFVPRSALAGLRDSLSSRSARKRHLARRPSSSR